MEKQMIGSGFYILNIMLSSLLGSINARKSQALTKAGQELSRESQEKQLAQQRYLQAESYKQQIRNMQGTYDLQNWPLNGSPMDHLTFIKENRVTPLTLIITPIEPSGMLKELSDIWREVSIFFQKNFSNGNTTVIQKSYRNNYAVDPLTDYRKIYSCFRNIPTLYIAPYVTERQQILGVTIAFWGIDPNQDHGPVVQNLEIDIRKLYIDTLRREAMEYQRKLADGSIIPEVKSSSIEHNIEIFSKESKAVSNGINIDYLDRTLALYKDLKPSTDTYIKLLKAIVPMINLLASAITDIFYVLSYGTTPIFPLVISQTHELPDTLLRGVLANPKEYSIVSGEDYINALVEKYVETLANGIAPEFAAKYLAEFEKSNFYGCRIYEEIIYERINNPQSSDMLNRFKQGVIEYLPHGHERYLQRTIEKWCDEAISTENKVSKIYNLLENKNYAEARILMENLSEITPQIQYNLGVCYINGLGGEKKEKEGIVLWQKASEGGCSVASRELSFFLKKCRNEKEALYHLQNANSGNYAESNEKSNHLNDICHKDNLEVTYSGIIACTDESDKSSNNKPRSNEMFDHPKIGKELSGFFNKSLVQLGNDVLDGILGVFASEEKSEKITRLTYGALVSRVTLLGEKVPEAVSCKCIICKEKMKNIYYVGLWPMNSNGVQLSDKYGLIQQTMEVESFDDKLTSLLKNGVSAELIIQITK